MNPLPNCNCHGYPISNESINLNNKIKTNALKDVWLFKIFPLEVSGEDSPLKAKINKALTPNKRS